MIASTQALLFPSSLALQAFPVQERERIRKLSALEIPLPRQIQFFNSLNLPLYLGKFVFIFTLSVIFSFFYGVRIETEKGISKHGRVSRDGVVSGRSTGDSAVSLNFAQRSELRLFSLQGLVPRGTVVKDSSIYRQLLLCFPGDSHAQVP